jgi:site-specific DNA-cytosine methylase
MKKIFNVVDMFCGAGGESTGIMQAAAGIFGIVQLGNT